MFKKLYYQKLDKLVLMYPYRNSTDCRQKYKKMKHMLQQEILCNLYDINKRQENKLIPCDDLIEKETRLNSLLDKIERDQPISPKDYNGTYHALIVFGPFTLKELGCISGIVLIAYFLFNIC